ncbi:hypothetical protein GF352_03335 [archaeon]|nr:hypothetical protein [archaeon]
MNSHDLAISELTRAESLISNWKFLPGFQLKVLTTHLIRSLDAVASYILNEDTVVERSYLTLSRVRLFSDVNTENSFYDTYYFLKNLLRKNIQRINAEKVKIISYKHELIVNQGYFQSLIDSVKKVVFEAFD